MSEKEVKVDKGFRQQVLREIYATRDKSIVLFSLYSSLTNST